MERCFPPARSRNHIFGQKKGKDDVYDLVSDNYDIKEVKKVIIKKVVKKKVIIKKVAKKKYGKLNIKQIKAICKKKGIKGYSKWNKAKLIRTNYVFDSTQGTTSGEILLGSGIPLQIDVNADGLLFIE